MEIEKLIEALRGECEDCSECGVSDKKCHSLYYCPNRDAADALEQMQAQLADRNRQLAAAVGDLKKHCRKCTHQLDNEFGCDCEGGCDPAKWWVAQESVK